MDHDQRFKTLLKEFFPEFLLLFFPVWAKRFDVANVEWLEQEIFSDPPQGDVSRIDLVAKLRHFPIETESAGKGPLETTLALIHVEIESRESAVALRERMWLYYSALQRKYDLDILPIAVFLRVGLEGIGIESYVKKFDDLETLRFQYLYVGFPALDAERHLLSENVLGVALCSLMKIPEQRRAWFRSEALRRILLESKENDYRKMLLSECIEAYLHLNEQEQSVFEQMLQNEPYTEIVPMMQTTFEKGMEKGKAEGKIEGKIEGKAEGKIEGLLQAVCLQLAHRFGELPSAVFHQLEAKSTEQLQEILIGVLDAPTLDALGLSNEDA